MSALALPWSRIETELATHGAAVISRLLSVTECATLIGLYQQPQHFRARIDMARYRFGSGEYQYFNYPLPPRVAALRAELYTPLAQIANRWQQQLRCERRFPDAHAEFLECCRAANQTRPTPLLLRYRAGDYNCLHQDLYGEQVFPLQLTVLLSAAGQDFTGGEFVLTEQRARAQSRVEVVALEQGDAVVFPVRVRPSAQRDGFGQRPMRHGVSRVRAGERYTLGIVFHDAA